MMDFLELLRKRIKEFCKCAIHYEIVVLKLWFKTIKAFCKHVNLYTVCLIFSIFCTGVFVYTLIVGNWKLAIYAVVAPMITGIFPLLDKTGRRAAMEEINKYEL